MRVIEHKQLHLGQTQIARIEFDVRSRDDIPQILRGLQHIYVTKALQVPVFEVLEKLLPEAVDTSTGRPGMDLWNAFVLATLRVNLNWDYDRLLEMANQHQSIRQMLGHGTFDSAQYKLQTIKDNVALIDEDALSSINKIVVDAGHHLLKKTKKINARCDSFVLESNIHYPTDINLLLDAMRCSLRTVGKYCDSHQVIGWRQWKYNTRQVKKQCRKVQKIKHSTSKDPQKKQARKHAIQEAHQDYIVLCSQLLEKRVSTQTSEPVLACDQQLTQWIKYGKHPIDLIRRRVIEGEVIPHQEKIFSIFEDYSEWISKGKAGVPVEFGLKVCIVESTSGYILHHQVMQECTDSDIAVDIMKETKAHYPQLRGCSFDKGFHSPKNQQELPQLLEEVILPKKGRWSKADRDRETAAAFKTGRRHHSAVESAINALEVHGLDRCRDRGLIKFKQYVSLAIVGRNLQKIGAYFQEKELQKLQREEKRKRQRRLAAA